MTHHHLGPRARTEVHMPEQSLIPVERIERAIFILRGHTVMLDLV